MPTTQLSQIQREILIHSPRSRVWKALTDIGQFGQWFGAELVDQDATFRPGAHVDLISTHPGACYQSKFSMEIAEIKPESYFSWHWHPGAPVPGEDLSSEPLTKVEFRLEEIAEGTRVTVTESGFDRVFEARRVRVLSENEAGWKFQLNALAGYFRDAH